MHEMSIAANILEIAEQQAVTAHAKVINQIEVEIGQLAGIEVPSLEFCFGIARGHCSLATSAELVIHEVAGRGRCPKCSEEFAVDFFAAICPDCQTAGLDILQGRELKVLRINVD